MVTLALTLHGPGAYAEDPVESVEGLAPAVTVHPKRHGYYTPVDGDPNGGPGVSIQQLPAVPGEAMGAVDEVAGTAGRFAGAAAAVANEAVAAAGSYRILTVTALLWVENERGQKVFEDRLTFRYRQSTADGAISGIVMVPEQSYCMTGGALSAYAFTPVTETCWYVLGTIGPDSFSFSSGARFATYVGPVLYGRHTTGEAFITRRDGSHEFVSGTTYNGMPCATISTLPPRWRGHCDSHLS